MTFTMADEAQQEEQGRSSAYCENVLPGLAQWNARGERTALVTLVGVDGNAPRSEGAQMAVSESGRWVGYISGGCLEQTIALQAVEAIRDETPKLVRYGKGSPYFDIRLPCGSGLDIFIQPLRSGALIRAMQERLESRQPFLLKINLETGTATLEPYVYKIGNHGVPTAETDCFFKLYTPTLRCLIIGSSPIAVKLAELSACAGFDTVFYEPDIETLPSFPPDVQVMPLLPNTRFECDEWTAAILAFHDHEREIPAFSQLLRAPSFFLGAIGSQKAHEARKAALTESGFSASEIKRIRSPAGLVPGLKSASSVALSILAEVVAAAREREIIS